VKKMKKTDWQFLVNTLMFICIFAVIMIGIIMGCFTEHGHAAREAAKYFLGLHRHQWGDLHFILSIAFCALLILHLALDWPWIKAKAKQVFKSAWVAGLALIVILPFGSELFELRSWRCSARRARPKPNEKSGSGSAFRKFARSRL
jgi:TRAP-type C4-dicarboxylate transport system permease small subunit